MIYNTFVMLTTYQNLVEENPLILGGMPVIRGTRFPVARLLALLGMNYKLQDIKNDYPYIKITKKGITTILNYHQKRIN